MNRHILPIITLLGILLVGCQNKRMGTANGEGYAGPLPLLTHEQIIDELSKAPSKLMYVLERLEDTERQQTILPPKDQCPKENEICVLASEVGYENVQENIDYIIQHRLEFLELLQGDTVTSVYLTDPTLEIHNENGQIPAGVLLKNGKIDPRNMIVYKIQDMGHLGKQRICEIVGHEWKHHLVGDDSLKPEAEADLNVRASVLCSLYTQYSANPDSIDGDKDSKSAKTIAIYRSWKDKNNETPIHYYSSDSSTPNEYTSEGVSMKLFDQATTDCNVKVILCSKGGNNSDAWHWIDVGTCNAYEGALLITTLGYGCSEAPENDSRPYEGMFFADNWIGDRLLVNRQEVESITNNHDGYRFSEREALYVPKF